MQSVRNGNKSRRFTGLQSKGGGGFFLLANIIKVPSRRLLKERKTASGDEPRRIR